MIMDTSDRGLLDIERFDREPGRPVFHGLIGDLDPAQLRGLSTEEKIPHVLAIIGADTMSTRMRASLLEIDQTISTWPQLASSVAMGGAVAADVARRILLGLHTESGRFFVDVEETVRDSPREPTTPPEGGEPATPPVSMSVTTPPSGGADVPVDRIRHLVTMASLAPSGGNAQPWRWLWQERALHLSLDARHSRALLDFQSLASVASLGAAAENLVLAAHADGLGVHVASFPVAAQPPLVAAFTFCANGAPNDESHAADALSEWIEARASNRRTAARTVLGTEVFEALAGVVTDTGADVRWLKTDAQLDEIGRLLGAGDRLIFLDRRLHQELMSEVVFGPRTIASAAFRLRHSSCRRPTAPGSRCRDRGRRWRLSRSGVAAPIWRRCRKNRLPLRRPSACSPWTIPRRLIILREAARSSACGWLRRGSVWGCSR